MTDKIEKWLQALDLVKYRNAFAENEIEFGDLAHLTEDDLKEMGLPIGPRRRILAALADTEAANLPAEVSEVSGESKPGSTAERRQLTIMFCDLVGSTELSRRLDPEDLRDIMRRYQDAVTDAVSHYGGHVAKYLGDGVLAYFGWPMAYEDQAERAIRAGLEAVVAVSKLPAGEEERIAARVGIDTGPVVVGDLVGESGRDTEAVTGETPNLAARLQGVAAPEQVVIGETTRQLIGRTFSLDDLGEHRLKGFDDPVRAWAVEHANLIESRFEAARSERISPIIGRHSELQLLLDRWRLAADGEGQAILISGEAGIGKSRLLQSLSDAVAESDHFSLLFQCSPYHGNSALYPIIRHLEVAAGFDQDDANERKLDRLESLLGSEIDEDRGDIPFIADLMSLTTEGRYGPIELPPQKYKARLFEALVNRALALAQNRPVLLIFEDAHWSDPTSLDLLQRLVDSLQSAPILLIITHRPEWQSPLVRSDVTALQLNRLGRKQAMDIVRPIAGEDVPDSVIERIIERADGVPLFVEELTKALVESGITATDADIPTSLHASLTERLDRLGDAKEIAQISAVIGREISYPVLAAVSGKPAAEIETGLDRLLASGLFLSAGAPPDADYSFKHALVRDAAYDSLLTSSKKDWHQRVAEVLEQDFPSILESQPEIVGNHWQEAGKTLRALQLYHQAGQGALRRSASQEAVAHLSTALTLFDNQPSAETIKGMELDILAAYSLALMNLKGFGDIDVGTSLQRAYEAGKRTDDETHVFDISWNLWLHHQVRGNFVQASSLAEEVVRLANEIDDEVHLLEAHHAVWTTAANQGQLAKVQSHCEAGIALYAPEKHHECTFTYGGHDPGVCGLGHASIALSALGSAEKALQHGRQAVELAEGLGHGPSITIAGGLRTVHLLILQQPKELLEASAQCIAAAEHYGPPHFRALGLSGRGWAKAAAGDIDGGIEDTRAAVTQYRKTGATVRLPISLMALTDVLCRAGELDQAATTINEGIELIANHADKACWAELIRLKAEILEKQSEDPNEVEAVYREAIDIARVQEARLFELRACTGLAKFYQKWDRKPDARDLLAAACSKFASDEKLTDLDEAKSLLGTFV